MKGFVVISTPTSSKRRWRSSAVPVLVFVVFSLLAPFSFFLGLLNGFPSDSSSFAKFTSCLKRSHPMLVPLLRLESPLAMAISCLSLPTLLSYLVGTSPITPPNDYRIVGPPPPM